MLYEVITRKVPPKLIVESKIMAVKAGIDIATDSLESHFLAGGNVSRVIQALIAADKANIDLPFNRAAAGRLPQVLAVLAARRAAGRPGGLDP